jgi:hypothetical protein
MALTKTPIELSSTPGIVDNSNATAITIDSSGAATFNSTGTFAGGNTNFTNDADVVTLNGSLHTRLLIDTSSTGGHQAALVLESNGNQSIIGNTGSNTSFAVAAGNLTLDVAGEIILDADQNGVVRINDAGSNFGAFFKNGTTFTLKSELADYDMIFSGNDGGATIDALTLDMSAAGAATFNSTVTHTGLTLDYNTSMYGTDKTLSTYSASNGVYLNGNASGWLQLAGDGARNTRINLFGDGNSAANQITFHTNNVHSMSLSAGGIIFNESGIDRDFRVESDGNNHMLFVDGGANQVVVGTSSPITGVGAVMTLGGLTDTRLVIDGASSSGLYLTDSGAQGITMRNASGDLEFYGVANKEFAFNENGIDTDFRVESDVYSHMLFVDAGASIVAFGQTQNIAGGGMYFNHNNATRSHLVISNTETSYAESLFYGNRQNSDGQVFQFRRQNSTVGSISVDTNSTTYNTTSDRRLKKDIETITDGTDKLMAMNPVTHGWKADPEAEAVHGFIAQEMMDIVPEAVSGDPEGEDMMSMDYGRITPVIVAALQEANKKIMELENRINELEGK